MTRSRAVDANTPNALMAEYYGQRATAGLIIAEGTSPSPNGLGYPRIPFFNQAQVRGWKLVTDAAHAQGAKIFVQLMHTGRVDGGQPAGRRRSGRADGRGLPREMYTDSHGMQPHSTPRAMTEADIAHAVQEYAQSARFSPSRRDSMVSNSHAANGYLIEQFLNGNVNQRADAYGGGIEGRNRFALEVARGTVAAIGADRVGIRLSPYGVFNSTGAFPTSKPSTWR